MRDSRLPVQAALLDAARKRARPFIMTSLAMGGGMLPIALGDGDAESRALVNVSRAIGNMVTVIRLSRGTTTIAMPMDRVVKDPHENVYLRPGDVLTLVRDPQTFLAYGATGVSNRIPFEADSVALAEALGKVGGLQDQRADPSGVFVFRYEPPAIARALRPKSPFIDSGLVPVVYRLNMRDPASLFLAQSFPIFDRDMIDVSNAPITDAQKAFQVFGLVPTPVSTGASVAYAIRYD